MSTFAPCGSLPLTFIACSRKSTIDQAKEKVTPDSQKSTLDQAKESLTGTYDR